MATITFNGVSAGELGMFVEQMPDAVRAKRRVERVEVPGRGGVLHIDEKSYEPVQLKAVLNANGASKEAIHEWLNGSGDLVLSDEPDKCYKATVYGEVKSARRRTPSGRVYDQVTVTFECEPFRYETYPEVAPYLAPRTSCTLDNPGTEPADPLIIVRGSGQVRITVGDISVTLGNLAGEVAIDCDAKCAYKGNTDNQVSITLDDHAWPVLGLGQTRVSWSGNVQRIEFTPNWRWL